MDANKLTIVAPQQGQTISMVGDTYRIVITGEQTGGAYAVIDMLIPKNGGPGPHSHAEIEESFYVMDGEIEVVNEQGADTAGQGTFVNIPLGGMVHRFTNKQDKPARLWCTVVPAGLDAMFLELGKPVQPGQFLPPPQLSPEDQKHMQAVAEKYGQKLYPPNYLGKK